MLKCEMCLGRTLKGEMAVLRSVDRSIEYQAGTAIEIAENTNRINVKVDGITVKIDPNGCLSVDIPDIYAVTAILETLSRYPLDHNYRDIRPLIPNGVNQGKWATETVGANNKPIYLNSGVITASNGNIGSNDKPIYMDGGEIKPSTATKGSSTKPMYMDNGQVKASDANIGSTIKPVYVNSGDITAINSNVGTSTQPVYVNGGELTQCGSSLDVSITGNAPKDGLSQKIDETYIKGFSIDTDDFTITITKGNGTAATYTWLQTIITAIGNAIDSLTQEMTDDFVKRTPTDVPSNPTIYSRGNVSYNSVAAGSHYSNNVEYFDSTHEEVHFDILSCSGRTYDSNMTYYDYDDTIGDYVVASSINATNFLTNRDHLYIIYNSSTLRTFEADVAAGYLYTATDPGTSTTWQSTDHRDISIIENEDTPNEEIKGVKHSGILTARSKYNTHMYIYDMSTNLPNGQLLTQESRRDSYGVGYNSATIMLIKGHKYKVVGYSIVSIGWFGD